MVSTVGCGKDSLRYLSLSVLADHRPSLIFLEGFSKLAAPSCIYFSLFFTKLSECLRVAWERDLWLLQFFNMAKISLLSTEARATLGGELGLTGALFNFFYAVVQ